MNKTQNPGIYFLGITLLDLSYSTNPDFNDKLIMPNIEMEYECEIFEPSEDKDKRTLVSVMSFNLFKRTKQCPFRLAFKFKAIYKADIDSPFLLETFSELQAPANMLPYARELISNITSRGMFPTLNLPPINLQAALSKKKKKAVTDQSK